MEQEVEGLRTVMARGRRIAAAVWLVAAAVAFGLLYLLSRSNYLLFHTGVELFAIVVGVAIFLVAWHTRKWASNGYLLFLGIAYLFVALVDVFHTLAFKGMGVFPGFTANEPTQFWIFARYIEGFSLLLAPLFLTRRLRPAAAAGAYVLVTGLGLLSICRLGLFPDSFVEGQGLTTFKVASEYVISAAVAGGIVLLYRRRDKFDPRVFRLLVAAMAGTIAAEMSFTLYVDVYGVANMVGHLFKVVSFFLVYRAVVVTGLAAPYEMVFRDLMRSRDEVRRERDQAQRYLDVAEVMLLVLDADGRIRTINRKGAELLGIFESELVGRDWYEEFVPAAHRSEARALFARIMRGELEGAEHAEGALLTHSGAERIVLWHNTPITDDAGEVRALLRSGEDVTEQRDAAARLIESEQRFRLLFEQAPDAYYLSDLQGRFVDANAAAERLTGYRKEELVGNSFLECGLLRPEDVARATELLALSIRGQATGPDELSLVRKPGDTATVDIRTVPVVFEGRTLILGIARDVSERKTAADRIRLERDYFLSLFSNSPEAIALLDADYRVVDVNAAFSRLFDYDRETAVGRRIDELVVPDELQHEAQELSRLGKMGQSGTVLDTVRRRSDGSMVAVTISDAPITFDGRTVGVFAMYRDIGERKRAEQALRASEEKFRALFEQSIDAIYVHAYDGTHLEANQAWLEMFGYTREELPFIDSARDVYVDPRDRVDFLRRIQESGIVADEVRFKKKNGLEMLCQRTVVARRDEHGKIIALQGIIRDVTAQRHSEELVRRSEQQYRSLFEQSRDAIYLIAPDGAILNVNDAAEVLFGYHRSELLNMNVSALYADAAGRPAVLAKLNAEGGLNDFPLQFRHKNGAIRDCEVSSTILRNHEGALIAYQTLIRDVTERRRAEEVTRRSEARLRSLVTILERESATLQDLLDHALNEAVALTESRLGYIYLYDDAKREFTLNTWSREVMQECTIQQPDTVYQLDRTGIWGEAVRQRRPIVVNDFDAPNPLKKGCPEGHAKLHKYATIPVFSGGRIVAVVGVANKESDYTGIDVLQLTLLMDSVWREVERRRSEAQVRDFSQRLEQAMSAGSLAWWQMELPSGRVVFDERKATMLGYAPARFSHYSDFTALLPPEDREAAMKAMRDHLEGRAERYEVEYRIQTAAGDYRWFRDVGGVTERDAEAQPKLVTGIVVDITGLKSAEERLSQSNRDLRTLAARLDATREEERASVAWELHDEVAQALSVIRLDITTCSGNLPQTARQQVEPTMTRIVALLDATIARLRRLYMDLVPVMLEDLGLAAAIEWHAEQYASSRPVSVGVGRVEDLAVADERTSLGLFRILEELLAHLSSHPGTTHVTIDLVREDGHAVLRVSDDGHGFERGECEESCELVLAGVRERARQWGGVVSVATSPARGTVVDVTAPLRPGPGAVAEHVHEA